MHVVSVICIALALGDASNNEKNRLVAADILVILRLFSFIQNPYKRLITYGKIAHIKGKLTTLNMQYLKRKLI